MKKMITNRRKLALASFLAFAAALCALAVVAAGNLPRPTATAPDPVPPMTLVYEVYGPSISVGDRSIDRFKETRKLEYRGPNDWKETVITSPNIDLGRYGTASNAGSYYEVRGKTTTEYDAMDGGTTTGDAGRFEHRGAQPRLRAHGRTRGEPTWPVDNRRLRRHQRPRLHSGCVH